jgi:intein-encoded DNA endonuclease-like protein
MKKLNISNSSIIDLYNAGLSCQKIANQMNVSESFISKKLKELNITKRSNSIYRRRTWNENFFNSITTEKQAYWLGFLYADGCVHDKPNGQKLISLVVKDKEVIEKFIKALNGDFEVKCYSENYGIYLTSKIMFNDLCKLGCVPRKSLNLKFPIIDENLVHHFIRGYFDGDGTVFICNPKNYNKTNTVYKSIGIGMCGTYELLSILAKHAPINIPKKDKRKQGNIWYSSISGTNKALTFYNYLYKDATIWLDRKKNKFENYFKERGSETTIGHPTGVKV